MKLLGVLSLLAVFTLSWETSVDLTLQPGTSGEDVVDAVDTKIQNSHIFSDDHRFLVRSAYAESKFGTNPDTYSASFFGGIWQVEEAAFLSTQDPVKFVDTFAKIQVEFGIDWTTVTWDDLEKPLYSGLAYAILIESLGVPVPDTIQLQADFWKTNINQNPTLTADQFILDIQDLESNPTCFSRMNLVIVLDGSGSIGAPDFEKAKEFVADLVSSFSLASTKVGLIVFSNSPTIIFPLNNALTASQMDNEIRNVVYYGGGTQTDLAIDEAVKQLEDTRLGTTAPKVILVLTDGQSNDNSKTVISAGNAKAAGITTFAVGIGSYLNDAELLSIAGDDANHVMSAENFDSLLELTFTINSETCKVPQTPSFGQTVKDVVGVLEKRFFKYPLPSTGLTVTVSDITGKSRGFYSYTFQNPSSALNDGIISGKTFIPPNPNVTPKQSGGNGSGGSSVFMVIQGIQINTNFTLSAVQGDTLSTATFEFIRNGPVNPPVKCGGYTNAECQGACVARPRKWAHGTCNQYVCSCH